MVIYLASNMPTQMDVHGMKLLVLLLLAKAICLAYSSPVSTAVRGIEMYADWQPDTVI